MYKALQVEFRKKNANYASNNGMYKKKLDKVRIKRILLDLQDVIADSR